MAGIEGTATEPERNCPLCPRLVAFREKWRAAEPTWHNAPVPNFGTSDARLLIAGLAPGLRVVLTSGRAEEDLPGHGADTYLAKPFTREQLVAAVRPRG